MSYTRPIMTRDELQTHHVSYHGRDYRLSDDGYGDMEVAAKQGWTVLSAWGADGWDLGDWPYVVLSIRDRDAAFELQSVCEGDHSLYSFDSNEDREAALDYLFLWYGAERHIGKLLGLTYESRDALDRGEITVEDRYRGPYRSN